MSRTSHLTDCYKTSNVRCTRYIPKLKNEDWTFFTSSGHLLLRTHRERINLCDWHAKAWYRLASIVVIKSYNSQQDPAKWLFWHEKTKAPKSHTKRTEIGVQSVLTPKPGSYPSHYSADVEGLHSIFHSLCIDNRWPLQVRKRMLLFKSPPNLSFCFAT